MQHITIRREDYVAGTSQRPEVGVFTQTHVHQRPTSWGQITVGDTVWMKWSGGPIVAKSVVQGFRQLSASSVEQLRETTRGFRLFDLTDYWASLFVIPTMHKYLRIMCYTETKGGFMAKGQDSQKTGKKKAAKTLKEKRVAKKSKNAAG